jgi:hypothetical protein
MIARAVLSVPAIADALALAQQVAANRVQWEQVRPGEHAAILDGCYDVTPPEIRDALARDAKVAEIVAKSWLGGGVDRHPVSYIITDFVAVAALYPEAGK